MTTNNKRVTLSLSTTNKEAPMGGNIFENTTSIKLENIKPTIQTYIDRLGTIFPTKAHSLTYFEVVGSTGKKAVSGDIDLAIDLSHLVRNFSETELAKWGFTIEEHQEAFLKIKKRARTATSHMCRTRALLQLIAKKLIDNGIPVDFKKVNAGNIFTSFPQYDEMGNPTGEHVQIDWMVGDIEWLRFAYYSHGEEGLKGLHRTQLMLACFRELSMTFSHLHGVRLVAEKEWRIGSPELALEALSYGFGPITLEHTQTFSALHSWLQENASREQYDNIIERYVKILQITKAEVPKVLLETI